MADIMEDGLEHSEEWLPFDDGITRDKEYYYNFYSTIVYRHPYFSYVPEPPEQFTIKPAFSEIYPYLIPKYTHHDKYSFNCITPEDFNEKSIQVGLCHWIQRHPPGEVEAFLDFQYGGYIARATPKGDPTAFLDYLISTVQTYNDPTSTHNRWDEGDYERLKAMGKWIRSHPGYIDSFNQRLRAWVSLSYGFKERSGRELEILIQEKMKSQIEFVPDEKELVPHNLNENPDYKFDAEKAIVLKRLGFLSGYIAVGRKIMDQEDYHRLVEYTLRMVKEGGLPDGLNPITNVDVSQRHILRTYYLIHKELYGIRPKRPYFIDFLFEVFPNHFNDEKAERSIILEGFSKSPPFYGVDVDKWGKIGK
ncbi:hypothetical protein ACD591_01085 [Rufibacter glacialis]|uniref:Uncharacterized protein n=1 Tax=Rufibacter glacialis TaxID=1259555 RepID=A0A5M8QHI8_9BACT|nr:hypothetical protein [Rufibacter glacialis]KAA6435495.1 hypothetical protein FOE74_05995 [Rufibacter glacialis]GGK64029.1 hypothetical protein GCM10011405_09990 [Rufibacter glacialis]